MKLYLLRHANASESNIGDFQRELSNKGIVQCEALAQFVLPKLNDNLVDIYCSAAKRTKQTHLHIFKTRKTSFDKKLYLASAPSLLHFICELEIDRTLVLLAHNNFCESQNFVIQKISFFNVINNLSLHLLLLSWHIGNGLMDFRIKGSSFCFHCFKSL